MRDALATARALLQVLRGSTPSQPRICTLCGHTTRWLTPAQHARIGSGLMPVCARRRCTGEVVWATEVGA